VHNISWISSRIDAYNRDAHDLDLFTTENEDDLVVTAASDKGRFSFPIGSPGDARNGLTVGVAQDLRNSEIVPSGVGPTTDQRTKPEILAPGVDIVSALNPNPMQPCRTGPMTGTSMAAAAVSAAALLVRQYFQEGWFPTGSPRPEDRRSPTAALVKAMLLNATVEDPVYGGGSGSLVLDRALFFNGEARSLQVWDVRHADGLLQGEEARHVVRIADTEPLEVTLVWTDRANAIVADPRIANDLNLSVKSGRETYLGNVFGASNGIMQSHTGGAFDFYNNVEMVSLVTPARGSIEITVRRSRLGYQERQGYALVVTGAIVP
jgi:hypothetical protein